jgi:hypothetical protein
MLLMSGISQTGYLSPTHFLKIWLRPRPHVCGYSWKRRFFDRFGVARTRRFSLSRVEVFQNAVFVFTCGRAKTFQNRWRDDWLKSMASFRKSHITIAMRMLYRGRYHISSVFAITCGRAKTIRIRYAKPPCSKISAYVWTGHEPSTSYC